MKFLNDKIHGMLDYAVVVVFALAPSVLEISGPSALLSYALAVIHLAMTAFTNMPLGIVKIIPMKLHGTIELIVGLALIVAAWTLTDLLASGQLFFTVMGAAIFFVWVSSNYGESSARTLS